MLERQRAGNPTVDLAFTAMRDLKRSAWKPFMKAALERNPVSLAASYTLDMAQAAGKLAAMENSSIYDGTRVAQPDEVWNYGRGDGLEKAICLLNIAKAKAPQGNARIEGDEASVVVRCAGREFRFVSDKGLSPPAESDCAYHYEAQGVPMEPVSSDAPAGRSSFE